LQAIQYNQSKSGEQHDAPAGCSAGQHYGCLKIPWERPAACQQCLICRTCRVQTAKTGVTGLDAFHAEDLAEELVTARLS